MRNADDFVDEDWEREFYKDHMFLLEHEMELDEQYQQWCAQQEELNRQEQEQKPAILELIMPKIQESNGRI